MANDALVAIGIDLGTTFTSVSVYRKGKVDIVPNEEGNFVTPTHVAFNDIARLFGDAARNQVEINPRNSIFNIKRLIGRKFNDPLVQKDTKLWPFKVVEADLNPVVQVIFRNEVTTFTPEEITAMFLQKMKKMAEDYLNRKVTDAVITVPSLFTNEQRILTKNAGTIAGLNVLRIVNAPTSTAIAIAYGFNKRTEKTNRTILVYDLGGGTFDVSVITIGEQMVEVKATVGDSHLGGEDFDSRLMEDLASEFECVKNVIVRNCKGALFRLRTACESAKRTLSYEMQASIEIPALFDGNDFSTNISRRRFEDINKEYFRLTIDLVKKVLDDAMITKESINDVVLIGGSTRIPKIQCLLKEFFEREELYCPEETVVYGAAIQAAVIQGNTGDDISRFVFKDIIPINLGIQTKNPADPNNSLMSVIINRNSQIPASRTGIYFTCADNQTSFVFELLQGEHRLAKENYKMGEIRISGIPPAPEGHESADVTYNIDSDGIFHVSAVLRSDVSNLDITYSSCGHLDKDFIIKMKEELEILWKQDEEFNKCSSAKDKLKNLCNDLKCSIWPNTSDPGQIKVLNKCSDILNWLENGVHETKELYKERYEEILTVVNAAEPRNVSVHDYFKLDNSEFCVEVNTERTRERRHGCIKLPMKMLNKCVRVGSNLFKGRKLYKLNEFS